MYALVDVTGYMSDNTLLSGTGKRRFNILAFDEQRAKALKEYLEGRSEVRDASINEKDRTLTVTLLSGTDAWEVEEAALAGGFAITEVRTPLGTGEGRLEIMLLILTILATALSFLGTYYNVVTGDIALALGAFIAFICGYSILKKAVVSVFDKKFGMELISAMAILAPLPYSYALGKPMYYASGVIILIIMASTVLNRYIEPRFRDMDFFLPTVALGENDEWVDLKDVKAGAVLKVKPGFRIPADCMVTKGEGNVLRPGQCNGIQVKDGSVVEGGSLLMDGMLLVKVSKDKGESKLKSAAAVFKAARAPIEALLSYPRSIERALLLVTIMAISFVYLFFGNVIVAIVILIGAAPCAVLVARPLALYATFLAASRAGAGFASHGSIERMSTVDTVVFDGLGSLADKATQTAAVPAAGFSEGDLNAIIAAYKGDDPTFRDAKAFGEGFSLLTLAEASKVQAVPDDMMSKAKAFEAQGKLVRYAFKGRSLAGIAAFELSAPESLKGSVERLAKMGIKSLMLLSGEPAAVSENIARGAGITNVRSRMDDMERLELIGKMVKDGKNVLAAGRACDISRFAANAAAVTIREPAVGFEGTEDAICGSAAEVPGLLSLSKKDVRIASQGMSFGFYFTTFAIIAASTMLVDIELMLLMIVASVAVVATNSARMYFSGSK